MNKPKEPEQLASIALSREEIASRQRTSGKMKAPTSRGESSGSSMVLWAVSIFALIFCVGLSVQLYQVKQQSDIQLAALTLLQNQLTSTDEQANLSVGAVKILLKEQDHEIRKLWDLANKRNKVDIAKNTRTLAAQTKKLAQHNKKTDALKKDIAQLEKNTNAQVKQGLAPMTADLKKTNASLLALEQKLEANLSNVPKDIAKTLDEHGKGIKAMDATRLQLMRRIQALDKQIKALTPPVQAAQP